MPNVVDEERLMDKSGAGKTLGEVYVEVLGLIRDWRIEGEQLRNEPEYDGGYSAALLKCANQLAKAFEEPEIP